MSREILVIDDNDAVLTLMDLVLTRHGFSVVIARSAAIALDILTGTTPDLILLDIMMPDMDGLELCKILRARAQTANIPIILQSARGEPQIKQRGLAAGADDFVSKLTPHRDLVAKINQMLHVNNNKVAF